MSTPLPRTSVTIRKGLDLPLSGPPDQAIGTAKPVTRVALVGDDYVGLKPSMLVSEGDRVKLGSPLMADKQRPGVLFTSPGSGRVESIHRGAKRKFESIVIKLEGDDEETFETAADPAANARNSPMVRENLLRSGLWTAFRTRPFSRVPDPESSPHAIFVTAIDSQPLAPDPVVVIQASPAAFERGLRVLSALTEGTIHLCKKVGAEIELGSLEAVRVSEFKGPHPVGLPGTHIHFLDPVSDQKTVWHIGYQDVIAIGQLFATGRLPFERVIALAGAGVARPRLVRTRLGASIDELMHGELQEDDSRTISGSVLAGRNAVGAHAFLGRYHLQVSTVAKERERRFMGWLRPGFGRFSITRAYAGAFQPPGQVTLTSSTGG
ncbi:MAG: NADH:ubiquinone reductase (Na(+)-transporting) subunit A, partial [Planctomycetes bacterium]|nr:NADH:ubiquinone reductase (Na(+)-transporting) subunit A [Planctomycetota bacterium]